MKPHKKILTFAHSGIGDAVMLLPLLQVLGDAWPDSAIACTAHPLTADILRMTELNADILPWPKNWRRKPLALLRGLAAIRAFKPDILIAPPAMNFKLASWTARVSASPGRFAILADYDGGNVDLSSFHRGAFTRVFPRIENAHRAEQSRGMLDFLGVPSSFRPPALRADPALISIVRGRLMAEARVDLASERIMCAHFGCEPANRTKLWPLTRMVSTLEPVCRQSDMRCVILWGPDDLDLVQEAQQLARQEPWLLPLPWQATLPEAVSILSMAELLVSNDCGMAHAAAGVGARVVTVFGPTNPRFLGPYGPRSVVVYRKPHCGPCYPEPIFYGCPHERRCLTAISPDAVARVIFRTLNEDYPRTEEEVDSGVFCSPIPFVCKSAPGKTTVHKSSEEADD
jgi:ADP-heptose:LPS heptosyltransferase